MEDSFGPSGRRPVHIYGCKFCYLGQVSDSSQEEINKVSDTLDL